MHNNPPVSPVKPMMPYPETLDRVRAYDQYTEEAAAAYGVPAAHIRALIAVESRGDPEAWDGDKLGLLLVSKARWQKATRRFPELAGFGFRSDWSDPRANIMVGVAAFKLETKGLKIDANDPNYDTLAFCEFSAGESTVSVALNYARVARVEDPSTEALKSDYLRRAVEHTKVYRYYIAGGPGSRLNSSGTVREAVELKCKDIQRYPLRVEGYLELQG